MLFVRAGQVALFVAALTVNLGFANTIHRPPTSGHAKIISAKKSRRIHLKPARGQRTIDGERATQIQQALISRHYLAGSPSGQWDSDTQTAMQKYQADHGWQTRLMPDSRALISLGLGPSEPAGPAASKNEAIAAAPTGAAKEAVADEPAANTLASVHAIPSS